MSTLIYAMAGGKCIGKCDENCYNAEHPECTCICGGRNHGKGKDQAIKNTEKYADQMIEAYSKERNSNHEKIKVISPLTDNNLFRIT